MLALFEGGRERTIDEYRELLDAAGLRLVQSVPIQGAGIAIIEASRKRTDPWATSQASNDHHRRMGTRPDETLRPRAHQSTQRPESTPGPGASTLK